MGNDIKYLQDLEDYMHIDEIICMSFTPEYIITGSYDHTIKVWNRKEFINPGKASIKPLKILGGHKSGILSLVQIDANRFASGSENGLIKIWDIKNGKDISLGNHRQRIISLVKLNDSRLVSASKDGIIKIWDINKGYKKEKFSNKNLLKSLVKIDDKRLACGMAYGTTCILNIKNGYRSKEWKLHHYDVDLLVKLDDRRLVSVSSESEVKILDIESGITKSLKSLGYWINSLVRLDEKRLVCGTTSGLILVMDVDKDQKTEKLEGHTDRINLLFKLEDNILVSGSADGLIKIWDINKGEEIKTLKGYSGLVNSLVKLDNNSLAVGSEDGIIKIWDIRIGKAIKTLGGYRGLVKSLVKLDDNRLASFSEDRKIKIWNLGKTEPKRNYILRDYEYNSKVISLVKLNDNRLASGSENGKIKIWDIDKGKEIKTLNGHMDKVNSLVKINETRLASGSSDKTIKIWDIDKGKEIKTLDGHKDEVNLLFKLEDNILVSCSKDQTIKVWDIKKGSELETVKCDSIPSSFDSFSEKKIIILGFFNGSITEYNFKDLLNIRITPLVKKTDSRVTGIQIIDENRMLFSTESGKIAIITVNKDEKHSSTIKTKIPIKTLLLGNSRAGKTTFGYWLQHGKFKEEIKTTDYMTFFTKKFENVAVKVGDSTSQTDVEFNIWDFGGQPEYQLAHQQNYDKTKVIFLIIDLSLPEVNDISNYFWIDRILTHKKRGKTADDLKIYLIGTKAIDNDSNKKRLMELKAKIKTSNSNQEFKHDIEILFLI